MTLHAYVVGYLCMKWYPGDPDELLSKLADVDGELRDQESDDDLLELALGVGLMLNPLRIMSLLEKTGHGGSVSHRMQQIEGIYPGNLAACERKFMHVMRISPQEWPRKLAENGLDRLNEIRR